jgi:excisionase family DNA binding protein
MQNLVPSKEVCERLGINRSTLTRWVAAGRIAPAHKLAGLRGAYLFTEDEVARLAQEVAA